jgi:uncharacterized repeat protein (TIGR03803 family)
LNSNYGTVFKMTASGKLTTLDTFDRMDGANPQAALVQGTNGKFYGTTPRGGTYNDSLYGTVYSITAGGTFKSLLSCDGDDCENPDGALVQGANGNFYGTSMGGGATNSGSIFSITPGGKLKTIYSFCKHSGCLDGLYPESALVLGSDGNFYGTTLYGGANTACGSGSGCGTIFSVTPSGTLTTLYNFCSQGGSSCTDGYNEYNNTPQAGLIQDTDGTFYGTTNTGGVNGDGTVFSLSVGLGHL